MINKYKVLALDIDGTLTTSDKVITPETVNAVVKLQEQGVKVVIASGRSEYGFRHIADELEFDRFGSFVMSFNGGKIINYSTGEVVYNNPLSLEYLSEIYDIAKRFNVGILGYEQDCLISGNGTDKYQEYDAWACRMKLKEVHNFPDYFSKAFNKCLLTGDPDKLRAAEPEIKKQFEGRLNVFMSEEFFIEILPYGIHKAAALEHLLNKLGCDKCELMCCGDGLNDITMIEYAGLGVAMANANPLVLQKADYITESNDNNGVLKAINKFFYNK